MFAGGLIIIIAFFSLAIDLSRLYNRKAELQNAVDTVALAAAPELNGTRQGIINALLKAADRFSASSAGALTYGYGKHPMSWSDSAMEFGSSPQGPWKSAEDAKGQPDGLLYVKVQTGGMDGVYGEVETLFVKLFTNSSIASTSARAVAGRSAIKVTPLGICAMRDESHRDHNGELEEYGYRRGVGYNLLDLNRPGSPAGQTFIVNPVVRSAPITDVATLAPFVCTGTMAMARLTGGKVTVSSSFPLSSLYYHLNSRFGSYTAPIAPCDPRSAPADVNAKEYTYNGGSPWMARTPLGQSAALLLSTDNRWTVAGPDAAPSDTTDAHFGPLWSYAKAVKYSSYQLAGEPEPPGGYGTFDTTAWNTLYNPGQPKTSTTTAYPSSQSTPTPYSYTSGSTFYRTPPGGSKSVANRRVLNLPLLECPVSGGKAKVLGIGKFFMTVSATDTTLFGEFAGLVPEQSLGAQVALYP
jgi:Flp pilus assembly protein TadG